MEALRNIRLGVFVIVGALLLIVALYLIGSKQNLFGNTVRIAARFHSVNGLNSGGNVRYAGIDIGTVERIEIENDTQVRVVMLIEEEVRPFIRKNSLASIGTEGLMGNRLVTIVPGNGASVPVAEGDVLEGLSPIESDDMLRTLYRTNENMARISDNIRSISDRVNSRNSLWSLLMDTTMADNVKEAIVNIKMTSGNSALITGDFSELMKKFRPGSGTVASLLSDTSFSGQLRQTLVNVKLMSDSMALVTGDLHELSQKMKKGEGAVGTLLTDTAFVNRLNNSMQNVEKGSAAFNENMEALKHNILLRNYYKKKEKEKK